MAKQSTPKSEDTQVKHTNLAAALAASIAEMPSLVKEGENKFAGYKYVSIDSYYETLAKVAARNGLTLVTRETDFDIVAVVASSEKKGQASGPPQERTFAKITYACDAYLDGMDVTTDISRVTVLHAITGPQTAGSAASYAEKVFFRVLLKAVTGEPDGDAEQPHTVQSELNHGFPGADPSPSKPASRSASTRNKAPPAAGNNAGIALGQDASHPIEDSSHHGPGPDPEAPGDGEDPADEGEIATDVLGALVRRAQGSIVKLEKNLFPVFKSDTADWSVIAEIFKAFSPTLGRGDLQTFWQMNTEVLNAMKETDKAAYADAAGAVRQRLAEIEGAGA